ncbi:MAG: hypothetical protein U0Q22_06195 [Acidimicrobiales bacterium]
MTIAITIAPDPRLVRPVRLAMGGLASLAGFDVEAIEDLRIAVNELTATLIERGDGSDLGLQLTVTESGTIRIEGSTPLGAVTTDDDRFLLSDQILSVVADGHGFSTDAGVASAWLERGAQDWAVDEESS